MTTFSEAFLAGLRADTPGAANRLHFNNAGAGLMSRPVIDAIRDHLELEASIGGYEAAAAMKREIGAFYESVAGMLHTRPQQIAFTTNATDSYNKALSAIEFSPGDVILTTRDDYVSNQIAFLQSERRFRTRVVWAETQAAGGVDLDHLVELMDRHRPELVAVTHVPTNSGLVQPVEKIGELCRERGLLYLVDACQSAGQLPLDVSRIHCDFLSATFRKFLRGPRGAGFLFVSERALELGLEPLFLDLHSARWTGESYRPLDDARRYELWERPYALLLGSRAAVDYLSGIGIEAVARRVERLAGRLRKQLQTLDGVRVLDQGEHLCGIVTLTAAGWEARDFKAAFDRRSINTSLVNRESARFDFEAKNVEWALRASPHYYNTDEEVERFAAVTEEILQSS